MSTGRTRSVEEIREIVDASQEKLEIERVRRFGDQHELHDAMQSYLAWDTIYEPQGNRVVTTVSRSWNVYWGGLLGYIKLQNLGFAVGGKPFGKQSAPDCQKLIKR